MQETVRDYQRRHLTKLIREVSELYGGEPTYVNKHTGEIVGACFLDEYIAEVIKEWSNDLCAAIACFEDLKTQAFITQQKITPKVDSLHLGHSLGHAAFREHYERLEREDSGKLMAETRKEVPRQVTGSTEGVVWRGRKRKAKGRR